METSRSLPKRGTVAEHRCCYESEHCYGRPLRSCYGMAISRRNPPFFAGAELLRRGVLPLLP